MSLLSLEVLFQVALGKPTTTTGFGDVSLVLLVARSATEELLHNVTGALTGIILMDITVSHAMLILIALSALTQLQMPVNIANRLITLLIILALNAQLLLFEAIMSSANAFIHARLENISIQTAPAIPHAIPGLSHLSYIIERSVIFPAQGQTSVIMMVFV